MGGTLTWVSGVHRLLSTSLFGGSGTAAGDMPGTCTLLGPEGPGTANVAGSGAYGPKLPAGGGGELVSRTSELSASSQGRECRPYVENYTVDASILETPTRAGFTQLRSVDLKILKYRSLVCAANRLLRRCSAHDRFNILM